MTVIYSNSGDVDTQVLTNLWTNFPDVNVIEVTENSEDYEDVIDEALENEEDTLILCGHGTTRGLLHPNFASGEYLIHENNSFLIHANRVIGIWCYAREFAVSQGLHGFFSSMFISNVNEALHLNIDNAFQEEITSYQVQFCQCVNNLIRNNIPLSEWKSTIRKMSDLDNEFQNFNYSGLTLL